MSRPEQFIIDDFEPVYLTPTGREKLRTAAAHCASLLEDCHVCPHHCGVNRRAGERGNCQIGAEAMVSSAFPHHGEEACLRGARGSGTIFFSGCNLRCVFCQNDDISQCVTGRAYGPPAIADMMLALQDEGCHNINFVTPTHVVPQMVMALEQAVERGLRIPIVYNTGGYDALVTLRLLDGLVDIYMPDFKLWSTEFCTSYLHAPDYAERAREAFVEMRRQVGDLHVDAASVACHGLLVRHLVMPGLVAESVAIVQWLASAVSKDTFVNIMAQYRPANEVLRGAYPEIGRQPTMAELKTVRAAAVESGLWRLG